MIMKAEVKYLAPKLKLPPRWKRWECWKNIYFFQRHATKSLGKTIPHLSLWENPIAQIVTGL